MTFSTGAVVNFYGTKHTFFGRNWRKEYFGLSFGVQYKIEKVSFGIRSTPSIQLFSTVRTGFGRQKASYNFDIEPNLALDVTKEFQLTGGFSYGINPTLDFGPDVSYNNLAY